MSRRTQRIAKVIQQSVGRIVRTDLSDPRIDTARTSITRVEVQEDLLRAKVYISVIGTEAEQRRTIRALNRAAGRIQWEMRRDVALRFMPALEFLTDERFKGAMKTWQLIQQAMDELREKEGAEAPPEGSEAGEARGRRGSE